MTKKFHDREDAGRRLARLLEQRTFSDPIIVAMARGGVPVGHEISKMLKIPLSVLIVQKIGAPHNPELGVGAITEGDIEFIDRDIVAFLGVTDAEISDVILKEKKRITTESLCI